ncbi:MAG: YceI family protein, partial [Saprospiraceae bacterium]
DEDSFKVHGTLTMRGVSKKIVLDADYSGAIRDPWGNTRAGVTVSGKLNRKDYGVSFGLLSETGGVALGDEIKISANMQFVMQEELQPA